MTFEELELIEPIMRALTKENYAQPTPIQEQAIPIILEGHDLLGCAQTGTGKTAAFSIPIIQQLVNSTSRGKGRRQIRALVVAPTRELALQIDERFAAYSRFTGLKNTAVFGGVKQGSQESKLRGGTDILVATPGRLLDFIQQGIITLRHVEHVVLDEADRMLDMGFIHDIRRIIGMLPDDRQSLFFSATMPPEIVTLSKKLLYGNPKRVTIRPDQTTADRVSQVVYFVSKGDKRKLLIDLLENLELKTVLVFSRTKYGADKIVRVIRQHNIHAEAIHGNKSQNARQRALENFKNRRTRVLVATDIAARGIDVDNLSHVINYDLPNIPETYVHRIGRTGRAEASGAAISFCDREERAYLQDIQNLIKQTVPVIGDHAYVEDYTIEVEKKPQSNKPQHRKSNRAGQSGAKQGRNGRWRNRKAKSK